MATRTATEIVTMICPNLACRKTISAPESARGTMVRCAYCQQPFRVPAARMPGRGQEDDDDRSSGKSKR